MVAQRSLLSDALPSDAIPVGYAALAEMEGVRVPRPRVPLFSSSARDGTCHLGSCRVTSKRPRGDTVLDHVLFALEHEPEDLLTLKRAFEQVPPAMMCEAVRKDPADPLLRRAWFFYEWLLGTQLPLPNIGVAKPVAALDPSAWYTAPPLLSQRHGVLDNLPGSPDWIALFSRSVDLSSVDQDAVHARLRSILSQYPNDFLRRVQRDITLNDTRSTFSIENEKPSADALESWAQRIVQAGREPLTESLLIDLQRIIFRNRRFMTIGRRHENVFLGDRVGGVARPKWIGAKPEDLDRLMKGLFAARERLSSLPAVCEMTAMSFGFCFLHPLQDGNGRVSRYLLAHVAAERKLSPGGVILPIAGSIWRNNRDYRGVFGFYDKDRMPLIDWRPTENGNVSVLGDTSDLYRFNDYTYACEFIARCVNGTLDHDFPQQISETIKRDAAHSALRDVLGLKSSKLDVLISLLVNNEGRLSRKRRKKGDFSGLTDEQVALAEAVVQDIYAIAPAIEFDQSLPRP